MSTSLQGKCFCGAVEFEGSDAKWCANCHCSICRHIHGAAFVTWVGFAREKISFTKGKEHIREFRSSEKARRGSCAICKANLFFTSDRWPDEIHVVRAAFANEANLKPKAHYFFDDRAAWIEIADTLPRYGGSTGTEKLA